MNKRNPIASAAKRIRPQIVPDKRNKEILKQVNQQLKEIYGINCN